MKKQTAGNVRSCGTAALKRSITVRASLLEYAEAHMQAVDCSLSELIDVALSAHLQPRKWRLTPPAPPDPEELDILLKDQRRK